MIITADQLQQLIDRIRREYGPVYRMQRTPQSEEEFIADVLRDEYGVTAVVEPTYEVIEREYLPPEWSVRPGAASVEPGYGGEVLEVPDYQRQILRDLDTLRRSPLAALVYIIARAAGEDNQHAMGYARLAQSIAAMIMIARPVRAAHSRSYSSTTGHPRDASTTPTINPILPQPRGAAWARQQLYQRDLQQRGYIERPAGTDRGGPAPTTRLRL